MADSNIIGSGTAAGAVQYLDFLSNKGHLTAGSVKALKTGFTKVTKTLGGDDWEKIEVRSIDVDEYMTRFANMTHGKYNVASLTDYKSRMRKVVSWYIKFLSNPGWTPDIKSRVRTSKSRGKDESPTNTLEPVAPTLAHEVPTTTPVAPNTTLSKLVAFPFPLSDGTLANLYLPQTLSLQDAKRMARFVETLVVEEALDE